MSDLVYISLRAAMRDSRRDGTETGKGTETVVRKVGAPGHYKWA
jgi:hypothetical protein